MATFDVWHIQPPRSRGTPRCREEVRPYTTVQPRDCRDYARSFSCMAWNDPEVEVSIERQELCRSERRTFGAADGPRHLEGNAGDPVVIRQVLAVKSAHEVENGFRSFHFYN